MRFSTVDIYEFGVVVAESTAPPRDLRKVATDHLPIYHGFTKTIVDHSGCSLNERLARLLQIDRPHRVADFYEERDVRYSLRASAYHVVRMAEVYAATTSEFERTHPIGTAKRGNTSSDAVYFEFDAYVGSARRVFEHLRRLVWKHFGGKGGAPGTFSKLVRAIPDLPGDLEHALTDSWNTSGRRLKNYRDCISHFVPLDPGSHTAWLEPRDGRWAMTVRVPSNPDARSRKA